MKKSTAHFVSSIAIACLSIAQPVHAQIIPDATLPTNSQVVPGCTICAIEGGTVRGTNLFHSLQQFSIPTGGEAHFNNAAAIQNILTRVTGNFVSNIDGLIRANGTANLFLLNPNGIIFGPNAQLNVGGSFIGTTASSFKFSDGSEFSATNPQAPPLLAINVPIGLQYGRPSGNVTVTGAILEVETGKTLALVGGSVDLANAALFAPSGRIEIGAVLDGIVELTVNGNTPSLILPPATQRANVSITGSFLDTATLTSNGGIININAGSLSVVDAILSSDALETGSAGSVIINAHDAVELNFVDIVTSGGLDNGRGGNIEITAGSLSIVDNSVLSTEAFGDESAGNILINVRDAVLLDNIEMNSSSGVGNSSGGNIEIAADSLSVVGGTNLDTTLYGEGNSGNIVINVRDTALFNDSSKVFTTVLTDTKGNSGNIEITANSLFVVNGSELNTSLQGQGGAGDIVINARDTVVFENNGVASSNVVQGAEGKGGNIEINTNTLALNYTQLLAQTSGQGNAGSVTINARNAVSLNSGVIFSSVDNTATGNGGNIRITTGSLSLKNDSPNLNTQSSLVAATDGRGNAGTISINARDAVVFERSPIFSQVFPNAVGDGGNIEITARSFTATSSGLLTGVTGQGNAGNVIINARESVSLIGGGAYSNIGNREGVSTGGNIEIATGSLSITAGAQLFASTGGQGNAGNVTIRAGERVSVDGAETRVLGNDFDDRRSSSIFSSAEEGAVGQGGTITITTPSFLVTNSGVVNARTRNAERGGDITINADTFEARNGGQVITTTSNSGQAGNITLNVVNDVSISGINQNYVAQQAQVRGDRRGDTQGDASGLYTNAALNSTGAGGNIRIATGSVSLNGGAQLVAATDGRGSAGEIQITAADTVNLAGSNSIIRSGSGSEQNRVGQIGNGGNINVTARTLEVSDSATFNAQTFTDSRGGNIVVNAENLNANTGGRLLTTTLGNGRAGDIFVNTSDRVNLTDPNTGLFANTTNGLGGAIAVNTRTFQISNNAELNATTTAANAGGSITVNAATFDATDGGRLISTTSGSGRAGDILANVSDRMTLTGQGTGLFANTTQGSTGSGGSIILTPGNLTIEDRAGVSVDSQGTGSGGNIQIQVGKLTLNNQAFLNAETASTQGGNITIQSQGILLLRRNSLISTTAGTAQAGGDGGNITITAPFIIGVLSENSDIRANAFTGKGGRVDITAQGIYGLQFQPRLTPLSDITASSEFGISGQVVLNILNVDPSRGLVALPLNLVDTSNLISQQCSPTGKQSNSSFVSTGRGGLPPNPTGVLGGETVISRLATLDQETSGQSTTAPAVREGKKPVEAIVEAQGWIIAPNGEVTLVANALNGQAVAPSLPLPNCQSR